MGTEMWKFWKRNTQLRKRLIQPILPDQGSLPRFYDNGLPVRQDNRYRVTSFLESQGIQTIIWLEDVLIFRGSNTAGVDLNLLVEDPGAAAACLLQQGYYRAGPEFRFELDPDWGRTTIRLVEPETTETAVVLLAARDWYYDLRNQSQGPVPLLCFFLDSLIEYWLNFSSKDYGDRLVFASYVAGLIDNCYHLTDEDGAKVKTSEYASKLKVEHRELHYDIVGGKEHFSHTDRRQYHVQKYREIKAGLFAPAPFGKRGFKPRLGKLAEREDDTVRTHVSVPRQRP